MDHSLSVAVGKQSKDLCPHAVGVPCPIPVLRPIWRLVEPRNKNYPTPYPVIWMSKYPRHRHSHSTCWNSTYYWVLRAVLNLSRVEYCSIVGQVNDTLYQPN